MYKVCCCFCLKCWVSCAHTVAAMDIFPYLKNVNLLGDVGEVLVLRKVLVEDIHGVNW